MSIAIDPCRWLLSLVAAAAIVTPPAGARAQCFGGGGEIHLFSDAALTDSTYQDQAPALFTVYVVHDVLIAAYALEFKIESSPGAGVYYAGETSPFVLTSGNSQDGILIQYSSCLRAGPVLVLQMQYAGFGESDPCSALRVVPHPDSYCGGVEAYLCTLEIGDVATHNLVINCSVPTKSTTWGAVKALYR